MAQIKSTCTSLTNLLHTIRQKKLEDDGIVDDDLIADAMSLFAQLSGQHHKLLQQSETEFESIYELKEKCEVEQDVLDEQLSYVKYMDTEYDVRSWKATDNIITVSSTDDHRTIKSKLDTELLGRRKMCEYGNTLEDEVSALRKSEQEMRTELERVRKVMVSMTRPSFLDGIEACQDIPTVSLTGPLFTLYQLLSATLREYKDITLSVSPLDPLEKKSSLYNGRRTLSDETWSLLEPSADHLVLHVRQKTHVVLRYHPKMKVVSCDHGFGSDVLAALVPGDDGAVAPHTSLTFAFSDPSLTELILSQHIGKLYCWLQELSGLDVITEKQRRSSNLTTVKFVEYILQI